MKNSKILGLLALCALLFLASVLKAHATDEQTITDLEHKAAAATTLDEAMQFYASGDEVALFDVMGPLREFKGNKAIRDHFAELLKEYKEPKVDIIEIKVISDGQLALARSVQHITGKGPDGKTVEETFRQTDLWRKTDGQWKIIDQHISIPVDMKTDKGDMASKM